MSIRLDKEWVRISEALQRLKGNMGVFQLADSSRKIHWFCWRKEQLWTERRDFGGFGST